MPEEYLGDGVYVSFDGYHVWLDCRGQPRMSRSHLGHDGIALEPHVFQRLLEFVERLSKQPANPAR